MRFIRPQSLPLIEGAERLPDTHRGADAAAAALRADYERWSRLGVGVLMFLLAVVGLVVAGASADAAISFASSPGAWAASSRVIAVGVFTLAAAVLCTVVLVRLWRSGRRLSRAAAVWLRVPYLLGVRPRPAAGWFAARRVNHDPAIFVRIVCCSLLFLVAVFGISIVFFPRAAEQPGMVVGFVLSGVLATLCLLGQLGGVLNIVRGVSERDPLWVRIRDGR